jgi:hypothetical protein
MANERSVAAVQSACTKATAEVDLKRWGTRHTGAVTARLIGDYHNPFDEILLTNQYKGKREDVEHYSPAQKI